MEECSVLKFEAVGNNVSNCGFVLAGMIGTEGQNVCQQIESALVNGTAIINVNCNLITFIAEGVHCMFVGDEKALTAIDKMLKYRHVQKEPFIDPNYLGFKLTPNM